MTATDRSELRARLGLAGLHAEPWSNGPGAKYAAHAHAYDKVLVVSRGSIAFGLVETGRSVSMTTGDRLDLPAGIPHDAEAGAQGVECLEAHVPAGTLAEAPVMRPAGTW